MGFSVLQRVLDCPRPIPFSRLYQLALVRSSSVCRELCNSSDPKFGAIVRQL